MCTEFFKGIGFKQFKGAGCGVEQFHDPVEGGFKELHLSFGNADHQNEMHRFLFPLNWHIIMDKTDEGTVGVLIDGVRHSQYIGEGGTGKRFALQNVLYKFLFRIAMFDTLFSHEMNVGCGIGQTHVAEIQFFVQ